MWSVVLKILSILGIILLCLLAFALTVVLLVLFCPVSYRGTGTARMGEYRACFRFRWLFGLVRGTYSYPEDGKLRIKVLWRTLYESGGDTKSGETPEESHPNKRHPSVMPMTQVPQKEQEPREQGAQAETSPDDGSQQALPPGQSPQKVIQQGQDTRNATSQGQSPLGSGESDARQKTDYKDLKEKLSSFLEIVQNEDNRDLVRYGMGRLGRIIKHIRPRYLWVRAVAGFGEPDLTGYAYGIYCAIRPFLGKKCRVEITPDFEEKILEGEAVLRGRIMAATVLYYVCSVLLDRRLRQLLDMLKKER